MEITDIRVHRIANEGKMKAIVSVTIDDAIAIHDIKIIEGNEGYFISMPSRKCMDGRFIDVVHPINTECRNKLQQLIIAKYENLLWYKCYKYS